MNKEIEESRKKLESFVEDLNNVLNDDTLGRDKKLGNYRLEVARYVLNEENVIPIDGWLIELTFKSDEQKLHIMTKKGGGNLFKHFYNDLLKIVLLVKDSVDNEYVKSLSFQTLFDSGLSSIKQK